LKSNIDIPKSLLIAIEREACKKSFFEFVKSFWDVVIKEEPVYNWHIPFLCEELQRLSVTIVKREIKPYDLVINIPPGTTKSTITTIMYPAWLWTQDASLRIITNSYSSDLSIEHSVKSRDIVTSEKYKALFSEVVIRRDKSAKGAYENTSTGARYTTSTGGTITGKHAHIIISDDPLNPSQAASDADRKTANEHTKTLSSRKVNKENTPVITIMQRLHDKDVTGYLLEKKGASIRHICLPAELSNKVSPPELKEKYIDGLLDANRLNRGVLEEAKIDLGSNGYAKQFEQSPTEDGGNIIKKDWFRFISPTDFERMRRGESIEFFVDTAFGDKSREGDPTGIIATCKIRNDLYITKAQKVYLQFPELIKFIPTFARNNSYDKMGAIRIEPKANGLSVIQTLSAETKLNVTRTVTPKDSKETRLNAESPKIECGRVYLIEDHWNEDFMDEIAGFPFKEHDEYVDLIAYACNFHLPNFSQTAQQLANYF
jgi:predicted phage terminase large subunit-like protein